MALLVRRVDWVGLRARSGWVNIGSVKFGLIWLGEERTRSSRQKVRDGRDYLEEEYKDESSKYSSRRNDLQDIDPGPGVQSCPCIRICRRTIARGRNKILISTLSLTHRSRSPKVQKSRGQEVKKSRGQEAFGVDLWPGVPMWTLGSYTRVLGYVGRSATFSAAHSNNS